MRARFWVLYLTLFATSAILIGVSCGEHYAPPPAPAPCDTVRVAVHDTVWIDCDDARRAWWLRVEVYRLRGMEGGRP